MAESRTRSSQTSRGSGPSDAHKSALPSPFIPDGTDFVLRLTPKSISRPTPSTAGAESTTFIPTLPTSLIKEFGETFLKNQFGKPLNASGTGPLPTAMWPPGQSVARNRAQNHDNDSEDDDDDDSDDSELDSGDGDDADPRRGTAAGSTSTQSPAAGSSSSSATSKDDLLRLLQTTLQSNPMFLANVTNSFLQLSKSRAQQPQSTPLYVNPRQYQRILKRRQKRAKLEAEMALPKNRPQFLHQSRHEHAAKRQRVGGRFASASGEGGRKSNETKSKTPVAASTSASQSNSPQAAAAAPSRAGGPARSSLPRNESTLPQPEEAQVSQPPRETRSEPPGSMMRPSGSGSDLLHEMSFLQGDNSSFNLLNNGENSLLMPIDTRHGENTMLGHDDRSQLMDAASQLDASDRDHLSSGSSSANASNPKKRKRGNGDDG